MFNLNAYQHNKDLATSFIFFHPLNVWSDAVKQQIIILAPVRWPHHIGHFLSIFVFLQIFAQIPINPISGGDNIYESYTRFGLFQYK